MINNKEVTDKIESLIQTNIDRVAGYQKAMEATDDPHLKSVFEQNKAESSKYLAELRPLVQNFNEQPETDTSTASDLYRGWMDIKDSISPNNNQSVLNWCEKGEDIAKNAYNKVVTDTETPFDLPVIQVLTKQQAGIQTMHDQIKGMRDANV